MAQHKTPATPSLRPSISTNHPPTLQVRRALSRAQARKKSPRSSLASATAPSYVLPLPPSHMSTRDRGRCSTPPSSLRIMAFNPTDPPKTYAEALDNSPDSASHSRSYSHSTTEVESNVDIDESVFKETPPRSPDHRPTSRRSVGEVFDEDEGREDPSPPIPASSPSLRHTRGRLEENGARTSYAEVAKMSKDQFSEHKEHTFTNGTTTTTTSQVFESSETNGVTYENILSKSGENLASVKPPKEYYISLAQDINEEAPKKPPPPHKKSTRPRGELVSSQDTSANGEDEDIRWAPVNIPIERRLQTLVMLLHSISIPGLTASFFVLCSIPILWPILIPYLIYVLLRRSSVDGTLSRRLEWMRRARFWKLYASYFPARLHRSQELEPTRKYIFGYHPHGIISHGAYAAFGTEALGFSKLFPGITNTLLTLDANFRVPIYSEYMLSMGLQSVSRESCENLLKKGGKDGRGMGRAITIVVGGAVESLNTTPRTLRLVLKKRKGFVKLAIRTGADIVPVIGFGENDVYEQLDTNAHPIIHKGQLIFKKIMGFTLPLFHARGIFNYDVGLMPYRRPINVVVGRPIRIQQSANPDPAYIDELHTAYVEEVLRIWDDWKDNFAPYRSEELDLVE